jgi:1-aminocyclopropane-1-carboxylate deaminase/D-cysteine desulfhydrase-like pyridoxal-dependent ACC family enzyme
VKLTEITACVAAATEVRRARDGEPNRKLGAIAYAGNARAFGAAKMRGVSDSEPALFATLPRLRERVPWIALGQFPTRVHRLEGLVPPSVELWVKREDESGAAYGGNKVRKLEFLLAEARASGATRLATLGGIGSHHVLATAIYGAQQGFAVDAVVFPQPVNDHVRQQILADAASGASFHPTRGYLGVPLAVLRARRQAHWIGAGGSSVTGTLGYVSAACELRAQCERGELPWPDVIYVPLGSCGTAAGLLYGLRAPKPIEIRAVRVVDRWVSNARLTRKIAARVGALVGELGQGTPATLSVEHRFFGGAYGRATPPSSAAVEEAARHGLRLEPTYTGKAMAALLEDARAGRLDGKRVLFLHTYNGVDLAGLIARAPALDTLPPLLRRHFPAMLSP